MAEEKQTSTFAKLLEKHELKKTKPRLSVLEVLSSRKTATSQPTLEAILGKEVDAVTLYRVLKTFEEKGIIHKIIDLNGTANYATCAETCTKHKHHDQHVHFNCTECYQVYCLDSHHLSGLPLPAGFSASSVNVIVYGVCSTCNQPA